MVETERWDDPVEDELEGSAFGPDSDLLDRGWEYRFVAAGPRLQETVELYESLGYRVHLEPASGQEVRDECRECRLVALFNFKAVYTRPS